MFQTGKTVLLRGLYNQRPWHVRSTIVVKDSPQEVVLALLPGAECAAPSEYIHGKYGNRQHWNRWELIRNNTWQLERYEWRTARLLILLEPDKFYASMYMWNHASNKFECYYVNFQLPFARHPLGFDTFDLELDIVIAPDYTWKWKDLDEYQLGIEKGILRPEWVQGIEQAKQDVFTRLEQRLYPFDGHWLNWKPDPAWATPRLLDGWEHA